MVATTLHVATANEGSTARSRADEVAFNLAEAALHNAYSTLYAASAPTLPGAVPERSVALAGGLATWRGQLNGSVWTLTGIGRVAAPQPGTADVVRTVSGRVRLGNAQQGSSNNAVWEYVYADSLETCTTLQNSVNLNVPLYVRGDLCLQNSAQVSGDVLQVGGDLSIQNTAHVGTAADPLVEAHIGGSCTISGAVRPCGPSSGVWAGTLDHTPIGFTKPPVDLPHWYANAGPGPRRGCTTGSWPGGPDDDTLLNKSGGDVVLTPGAAYDCRVLDAAGDQVGRIAWSPGSPGTLVVDGTIFVDGNVVFQNNTDAVYEGRGTIYASGAVTLQNRTTLCGVRGCDASWDVTRNLLAIVGGESVASQSVVIQNHTNFQGAFYAVNDYVEQNNSTVWGPIIAPQLYFQNSTFNHYVPLGPLLPGMPAEYEEVITLVNEPGSFS